MPSPRPADIRSDASSMSGPSRTPVLVLPAATLPPVGRAFATDVEWEGHALPLLLLRWHGRRPLAYLNLCPHMAVPLDRGGSGLFDRGRRHLLCTTHGALFRPEDGVCVSGPCAGDRLDPLEVVEFFGQLQVFLPVALAEELRARRGLVTALGPRSPAPDDPGLADPGARTPD
jgi:nitrite reductase/ring-hydroxylating ferredoxin subunit